MGLSLTLLLLLFSFKILLKAFNLTLELFCARLVPGLLITQAGSGIHKVLLEAAPLLLRIGERVFQSADVILDRVEGGKLRGEAVVDVRLALKLD